MGGGCSRDKRVKYANIKFFASGVGRIGWVKEQRDRGKRTTFSERGRIAVNKGKGEDETIRCNLYQLKDEKVTGTEESQPLEKGRESLNLVGLSRLEGRQRRCGQSADQKGEDLT